MLNKHDLTSAICTTHIRATLKLLLSFQRHRPLDSILILIRILILLLLFFLLLMHILHFTISSSSSNNSSSSNSSSRCGLNGMEVAMVTINNNNSSSSNNSSINISSSYNSSSSSSNRPVFLSRRMDVGPLMASRLIRITSHHQMDHSFTRITLNTHLTSLDIRCPTLMRQHLNCHLLLLSCQISFTHTQVILLILIRILTLMVHQTHCR